MVVPAVTEGMTTGAMELSIAGAVFQVTVPWFHGVATARHTLPPLDDESTTNSRSLALAIGPLTDDRSNRSRKCLTGPLSTSSVLAPPKLVFGESNLMLASSVGVNTTVPPPGGVVACAATLSPDRFPAASRART